MKRIEFKGGKYAGVRIKGKVEIERLESLRTLERAEWLTAQVESGGRFGTVISYDGTGMTAGLHQCIAVYPKEITRDDGIAANDQGPLWKLLNEIRIPLVSGDVVHPFWWAFVDKMGEAGMKLTLKNTVVSVDTGNPVFGKDIRMEFTGSKDGIMPESGPGRKRAEMWANIFSGLFSIPETHTVQRQSGLRYFAKRVATARLRFCTSNWKTATIDNVLSFYCESSFEDAVVKINISPELDLAVAMYLSHTVNAPGMALKKLCKLVDKYQKNGGGLPGSQIKFAKALIYKMGNTTFGRWDDDITHGRYQRTRSIALASKAWPRSLFIGKDAVMPKDLVE